MPRVTAYRCGSMRWSCIGRGNGARVGWACQVYEQLELDQSWAARLPDSREGTRRSGLDHLDEEFGSRQQNNPAARLFTQSARLLQGRQHPARTDLLAWQEIMGYLFPTGESEISSTIDSAFGPKPSRTQRSIEILERHLKPSIAAWQLKQSSPLQIFKPRASQGWQDQDVQAISYTGQG
jgi:hypothetical protein